jgi:hypothetical protein
MSPAVFGNEAAGLHFSATHFEQQLVFAVSRESRRLGAIMTVALRFPVDPDRLSHPRASGF